MAQSACTCSCCAHDASYDVPASWWVRTERQPLAVLGFSSRTYNCLWRSQIRFLDELEAMDDDELMDLRNFGRASLEEVHYRLGRQTQPPPALMRAVTHNPVLRWADIPVQERTTNPYTLRLAGGCAAAARDHTWHRTAHGWHYATYKPCGNTPKPGHEFCGYHERQQHLYAVQALPG